MLKHLSLRVQVVALVAILVLAMIAAIAFVVSVTSTARESIVRLNRDRLATLTENLSRRYGSVIGFIAPAQFEDTTLAERAELTRLLVGITREELAERPDVHAGFYHSLWNRQISEDPVSGGSGEEVPYERFLRVQLETTIELRKEQWSHNEVGEANFIMVTRPVFARGRLVGSAWALDDLRAELGQSWPVDVTSLLLACVVIGVLMAFVFSIRLGREVNAIQTGLEHMSRDLSVRLPVSTTELGYVSRSVNAMADTIVEHQKDHEGMMRSIQQQEKMASLGQLIAGVAHEIRTPISVIKTRVQLWERAYDRSRARKQRKGTGITPTSMTLVVKELDRIERIVRKLLYFSRRRSIQTSPARLDEMMDDVLKLMSKELRERSFTVLRTYAPEPVISDVDESEMKEVFLNLLTNAVEAMPNGGKLDVRVGRDPKTHAPQVSVHDSGRGIGQEEADKVMEPFYTTKRSGTGLGLSIANEIVRAHGGSLTFKTGAAGTTFTVTLGAGSPKSEVA